MEIPQYEILFKQIKLNFRYIGVPFNGTPNRTFFFCIAFLLTLMSFQEFAYITQISSENFLEMTQLAPCVVIGLLSVIKIVYLYFQRDKVFKLTQVVGELYGEIIVNKIKVVCVKNEVLRVKSLTKYYFVLNTALTSIYNFSVLPVMLYEYLTQGTVTYIVPYAILVPFRVNTILRWLVVYVQSVVCGFICVIFFTTVDTLYCILTCLVCINFSTLCNEIENLKVDDGDQLRNIVKRHQYLLELSQDLEDIFTGPNFFNVLAQAFIICSLLFNLNAGDLANVPGCVVFLGSAVLQILMMSAFGERLQYESGRVGDAAFLCPWYEMNLSNRKTIIIMRQRALRPQVLTAYKFSVIGYSCFSKIIRTSWSYFTLLNTVYSSNSTK